MQTPDDTPVVSPYRIRDEEHLDYSLRPTAFAEYIGQDAIKESLRIALTAAQQRQASVDHILLYGPPGLGKTSLAYLVAREMNANIRTTSGPTLTKGGDLAAILTSLQPGDILFIDEIHRLPKTVEEILYPAMEDQCLDILLGKGPTARSLRLDLPSFTLVGATTRAGLLSHPLRERFGLVHRLDFYREEELVEILRRSSALLNITATGDALQEIARRSRKTPRVANRLLRRVRDYALVHHKPQVDGLTATAALDQLDIDRLGLNRTDRHILNLIHEQFGNGPVGLATLAAASGEETQTLEEVIEPYLLQVGFLDRTPRGRALTLQALAYFGWPHSGQTTLAGLE
jgi:Holliday junction DNA helicase RuvB